MEHMTAVIDNMSFKSAEYAKRLGDEGYMKNCVAVYTKWSGVKFNEATTV